MVSYNKEVSIRVFFYIQNTYKKIYLNSGRFMIPGLYRVLDWFFAFLDIMDLFNKVPEVFSKCF